MEHVVPADLVRAVGEPVRVPVVGGREQELRPSWRRRPRRPRCRRDRSRVVAVALDLDAGDRRAGGVGRRAWSRGAFVSRVTFGCFEGRPDAEDLGVGLAPGPATGSRRTSRSGCRGCSACRLSSRRTPHGAWNGWKPARSRSSDSCWIRGSWVTAGNGYVGARTAARSGPRRGRRGPRTAARPACSTARARRRRSATRARRRRGAGARRSPRGAGGRARPRRTWSGRRRSSGCPGWNALPLLVVPGVLRRRSGS